MSSRDTDQSGFSNLSSILLLSNLRTGNPIVDSVIIVLFTTLLTYVTTHGKEVLKHLFSGKTNRIYVDKYDEKRWYNEKNKVFEAIQWYLSNLPNKARELQAMQLDKDDPILMSIAQNSFHTVSHQGEPVTFEYQLTRQLGQNSMITIREAIVLSYKGKKKNFLPEFVESIKKNYQTYIKESKWKQKLWNLERSEKSLDWESYETGNYKNFTNIIMSKARRDSLENDVKTFLSGEEEYKRRGVSWCRGYLFHGEPGCGKTSLIKAIANEARMNIYCMDLAIFKDDQEMRSMFRQIPAKSVVVFEDIDASSDIVKKRDEKGNASESPDDIVDLSTGVLKIAKEKKISFSALLNELDGIACSHGRIIIMTTNHVDLLDPALIRPGRIDFKMELKKATLEEIRMALRLYKADDLLSEDVKLPEELDGKYTIAQMCNMIVMNQLVPM